MKHFIGIETEIQDGKEYLCHVFTVADNYKNHFINMDSFCNDDTFARRIFNTRKKMNRRIVCHNNLEVYEIVEKMRAIGLADYDYPFYAKMVGLASMTYVPRNKNGEIITD